MCTHKAESLAVYQEPTQPVTIIRLKTPFDPNLPPQKYNNTVIFIKAYKIYTMYLIRLLLYYIFYLYYIEIYICVYTLLLPGKTLITLPALLA